MKKLLLTVLACVFVATNASAKVYRTEFYWAEKDPFNMMPSVKKNRLVSSCDDLGYRNSAPKDYECTKIDVPTEGGKTVTCYKDCHCPYKVDKYCNGVGEKGDTNYAKCDDKFERCTCKSSYKYCSGTETGAGDPCVADGGYKYASCYCDASYKEKCGGIGEEGSGAKCGDLWKKCKCKDSYQYCPSGTVGEGDACTADGGNKYQTCTQTRGAASSSCNNFTDLTGPLFDGRANTDAIINQFPEKTQAPAAWSTKLYFPVDKKISANDPLFGQGRWYLPSIGELFEMVGFNWVEASYKATEEAEFWNCIANSNSCQSSNIVQYFTAENRAILDKTFAGMHEDQYDKLWNFKFWSSNEVSANQAIVVGGLNYGFMDKDNCNYSVRPVTVVDGAKLKGNGKPEVGDVVTNKYVYEKVGVSTDRDIIGVIYWVSSDRRTVRIVGLRNLGFSECLSFNESKPYAGGMGRWGSKVNVANLYNNPWSCQEPEEQEEPETPEPESGSCNDFENATGALFDGQANTMALLKAFPCPEDGQGGVTAACATHLFFPATQGVEPDDPVLGKGKWYLPAVGEMMLMHGADWDKMSENSAKIAEVLAEGDWATVPPDAYAPCGEKMCDELADSLGNSYVKDIPSVLERWNCPGNAYDDDSYRACMSEALIGKSWTSSEVDSERAIMVDYMGNIFAINKEENQLEVRPVAKISLSQLENGAGRLPQVGDDVMPDHTYVDHGNGGEDAVGIIYWVAPDASSVRIVGGRIGGVDDGVYDEGNPYADYGFVYGKTADISAIPNNPWSCSGSSTTCTSGNDYNEFTGPLFDGKTNTLNIVKKEGENAIAAYAAYNFYPLDTDPNDGKIGKGQWYLPAIGELMMMHNINWRTFATVASSMSEDAKQEVPQPVFAPDSGIWNPEASMDSLMTLYQPVSQLYDFHKYAHPIIKAFEGEGGVWSSSEIGDRTGAYGLQKDRIMKTAKDDIAHWVFPVLKLSKSSLYNMGYEPEVGHLVGMKLEYGPVGVVDPSVAIGVIYWISPDGKTVRVVSHSALGLRNGVFVPEDPFGWEVMPWMQENDYEDVLGDDPSYLFADKSCTTIVENPEAGSTPSDDCAGYDQTCNYPQIGAGDVCNGLFMSCSCSPKLKTCNAPYTGAGQSCGGKYESCTCPSSYNRTCAPYVGNGTACGGKYQSCSSTCESSYNQTCAEPKVGVGQSCNGQYKACACPSNYVTCESPKVGEGTECEGRYESCACPSSYVTCPAGQIGVGEACDGKYESCQAQASGTGCTDNVNAIDIATMFYPSAALRNDAQVGAGKWHLPSSAEMITVCNNKNAVQNALVNLASKGYSTSQYMSGGYWTSSKSGGEGANSRYWRKYIDGLGAQTSPCSSIGGVGMSTTESAMRIRFFLTISGTANVGDIYWSNHTFTNGDGNVSGAQPVGVVSSVSNGSVTMVAVHDLTATVAGNNGTVYLSNPFDESQSRKTSMIKRVCQ